MSVLGDLVLLRAASSVAEKTPLMPKLVERQVKRRKQEKEKKKLGLF